MNLRHTFYTSGVDRIAEWTDEEMGKLLKYSAFDGGEELWKNLQQNLANYINDPVNGGEANAMKPTTEKVDYETLVDVLNGKKLLSALKCDD